MLSINTKDQEALEDRLQTLELNRSTHKDHSEVSELQLQTLKLKDSALVQVEFKEVPGSRALKLMTFPTAITSIWLTAELTEPTTAKRLVETLILCRTLK